ncbi:protein of unknown function [Ruminococcaceae bacterium BL-4]|jgi:hypothetical protein|nr:protein of unknown function [Ruminococcaceae bacterium BL-4]
MDNSLNKFFNTPASKAIAQTQERVNDLLTPTLKAMTQAQERVNQLWNTPTLKAMTQAQERVNELLNTPALKAIVDFQYRKTLSPILLKTFSLSSLNYAISKISVPDEGEVEGLINNNEPPVLTVEEKQDIANCVDIVAEHSLNWDHRLEAKAQSFMHNHPAAYVILLNLIFPILLNLFSSRLYDTIKVRLNPSADAPVVQEIPATKIIIIDRNHNYYYEVEFPSEDGTELKKGWVGKVKLNRYLKEVQEAVSNSN